MDCTVDVFRKFYYNQFDYHHVQRHHIFCFSIPRYATNVVHKLTKNNNLLNVGQTFTFSVVKFKFKFLFVVLAAEKLSVRNVL